MRITFCLPVVGMSGGIRVVAIYAQALARRGHRVVLLSPPPPAASWKQKLKSWLKGRPLPAPTRTPASHLDGLGLDHRILDRWRAPTDADAPDADVLIATWWETAEWIQPLGPSKGAKAYFVQHHEVFPHLPVTRCHATYRLPLHKIVIARWLKDVMKSRYGDDVVDLVPNSVDRSQFFSEARGKQPVPTVGFLYSTAGFKGLDVTLDAIRSLRRHLPGLRLVCFGSERPSPSLPLPEGAEFFLSPAQDQIRKLYSRCDVWMTASRSEGFNLPAMEAMACRTPVVSTKTGWPEEAVVAGKNGILVEVDDREGLARGATDILSLPPEEWKALSQGAYETSCLGSWEESTRLFEQALLHACRRSRRGEIGGTCDAAPAQA